MTAARTPRTRRMAEHGQMRPPLTAASRRGDLNRIRRNRRVTPGSGRAEPRPGPTTATRSQVERASGSGLSALSERSSTANTEAKARTVARPRTHRPGRRRPGCSRHGPLNFAGRSSTRMVWTMDHVVVGVERVGRRCHRASLRDRRRVAASLGGDRRHRLGLPGPAPHDRRRAVRPLLWGGDAYAVLDEIVTEPVGDVAAAQVEASRRL